tara:strand:- start:126 stop:326 length:201 start_codon:yes stop_codon:yes gene_type:complete
VRRFACALLRSSATPKNKKIKTNKNKKRRKTNKNQKKRKTHKNFLMSLNRVTIGGNKKLKYIYAVM